MIKWTENEKAEDDFAGVRMVLATEGEDIDIGCSVENTRYVGEIDWLMEGNVVEDDFVTDVKKTSGSNSLFTVEEMFRQPALAEWEGQSLLCRYSQKDHNDDIIHQDTVEAVIVYVRAKSDSGHHSWLVWIPIGGIAFLLVLVWVGAKCACSGRQAGGAWQPPSGRQ